MSEEPSFQELMHRLREGDQQAFTELVRRYAPAVRRALHVRLIDASLRRARDSEDLCQSVMLSFCMRAALGQYRPDSPDDLRKLLFTIARHKFLDHKRHEQAGRRDHRRLQPGDVADFPPAGRDPSPSQQAAFHELLDNARRLLTEEERRLADERRQGLAWDEIAARRGQSPDALRKKLHRAWERVLRQLGVDE
jgi:RNA polymerase sigma factor (sigma-70 family)